MKRKEFNVIFSETIKHVLSVKAETKEEAEKIAEEIYYNGSNYGNKLIRRSSKPFENELIDCYMIGK